MNSQDIDKAYVSPYDEFLFEFDATHNKTASQLAEIRKNKRIALLRDNALPSKDEPFLWKDF